MVVPWIGFELNKLLEKPNRQVKQNMRYFILCMILSKCQDRKITFLEAVFIILKVEALTLAEAMHSLTLMSVGLYGKALAPQNGAPIRLVVPWKYGLKVLNLLSKLPYQKHASHHGKVLPQWNTAFMPM